MSVKSPSVCLGAIEGIDFLLESYGDMLNDYERVSLHTARNTFLEHYKEIKHIDEPEEIKNKLMLNTCKDVILAYGKEFVSKDIEKDSMYQEMMQLLNEKILMTKSARHQR